METVQETPTGQFRTGYCAKRAATHAEIKNDDRVKGKTGIPLTRCQFGSDIVNALKLTLLSLMKKPRDDEKLPT
jgi:hypothetical protein